MTTSGSQHHQAKRLTVVCPQCASEREVVYAVACRIRNGKQSSLCWTCGFAERDRRLAEKAQATFNDRFWAKVNKTDGCWLWTASTNPAGYGKVNAGSHRMVGAHRVAYELLVGPIPTGLYIDHLCRTPACVNPEHLEPVTNAENILRGTGASARNARKTHCKRGHPFDEANTYRRPEGRQCRACAKDRKRAQA